jgi:hypothetical protein
MKKALFIFLLLPLGVGAGSFAVIRFLATAGPIVDAPELLELGIQDQGRRVSFEYTLHNAGRAPLELSQFESSCGCMIVGRKTQDGEHRPVGSTILAPGEKLLVVGRITAAGDPGQKVRASVTCQSNDPRHPRVRVEVVVELAGRVIALPATLSLGTLPRGTVVRQTVRFQDLGRSKPCRLGRVESSDPVCLRVVRFEACDEPVNPQHPALGKTIGVCEIEVTAPEEPQTISANLLAFEEGDASHPAVRVPLTATVLPRFQLVPNALVLPRARARGWTTSATCLFRHNDSGPFSLTLVEVPADLSVEIDPGKPDQSTATVTVTWKEQLPSGTTERRVVRLRAVSSDKEQVFTLPVSWWRPDEDRP